MTNQSAAMAFRFKAEPTEKSHEEELIRRARTGDGEAFGELYERLADRIYRYIYFRVTDEEMAEDLTSRVFLKAWEHLPSYKNSTSPFIAWLYTIAHNMLIDYYRVNRPTAPLDEIEIMAGDDPSPAEEVDRRSDVLVLRQALQKLTPIQREVVTMKLIDGMNTAEVAKRLHRTQGAIRALQMRALQSLAGILREDAPRLAD
jgi:RNA polymerase sigma-70 factor, ECF subfamily